MMDLVLFVGAVIVSEYGQIRAVGGIGAGVAGNTATRFNGFETRGDCRFKRLALN